MNNLGHWCDWCQCYHSSPSCFQPGRDRYDAALARNKELEVENLRIEGEYTDAIERIKFLEQKEKQYDSLLFEYRVKQTKLYLAQTRITELEQGITMLNAKLDDLMADMVWRSGSDVPNKPGIFLVFADDEMRQDYCYPDGHWLSCDGRVEYYRTMPSGPLDNRRGE